MRFQSLVYLSVIGKSHVASLDLLYSEIVVSREIFFQNLSTY